MPSRCRLPGKGLRWAGARDELPLLDRLGSPVRVDAGRGISPCNETTIASSKANPNELVVAWNDYREGAPRIGVGLSFDGGTTWTDQLVRPPLANRSVTEADPMTAYDDRTGTLWVGGLSFSANGGVFVARKDPGATQFGPVVMAFTGGGIDKGLMAAGPDPTDLTGRTKLYVTFNQGLIVSDDMGDTWSDPLPLDTGIGFLPRVGPGGELYITYWDTFGEIRFIRSLDGGASVEPSKLIAQRMDVWGLDGTRVPGDYRVGSFPSLAVDPISGALYCVFPDTTSLGAGGYDVDIYITRSDDRGDTWSVPTVVNEDPAHPGDQFFPSIEVERSGRVQLVYYDTRFQAQDDGDPYGLIDTVHAYSDDGGASWVERRLTSRSFSSEFDGFGGIFIGDYLGLTTAGGRTTVAYMSTETDDANIFALSLRSDPAVAACFGISCPCGNVDPLAGCGSAGFDGDPTTGALLVARGSDYWYADDLELSLEQLKPNSFGMMFAGRSLGGVPFGDGRRCINGQLFRYPVRGAGLAGRVTYGPAEVVEFSERFPISGAVRPGATWHYQGWYRDAGGPCGNGFNLTQTLSVTWR